MIMNILTIEDVKHFAKQLRAERLSFHPDDDFNDYVNFTNDVPYNSKEDAEFKNKLMNECFDVCKSEGLDIYEIMMEELLLESGFDKTIPLPSKQ